MDIADTTERNTAIAAIARILDASLHRLSPERRQRYLELAVFGEDVQIPGTVLARYWTTTVVTDGRRSRPGDSASAWPNLGWSATTVLILCGWWCMTSSGPNCETRPATSTAS
ncbi:MAG TPA: hypothetical protein VFO16_18510 [Pseudonocardiaceae bacterium]|nr:hypothetical protein [Pseudonocardiaceae bacterium]